MRKTKLKPNTNIRLIVDGFAVCCKVKHIASQEGLDCVKEINRRLAAGERFSGFGSRFGKYNIQINWD